jgi:hypothetical protein
VYVSVTRLRRLLAPIAFVWLTSQAGLLAALPIALWTGTAEELLECRCTHGDHAMCPMHHKRAPGSRICVTQTADQSDAALLASIVNVAGVLPSQVQPIVPPRVRPPGELISIVSSRRPVPPDPPPPRA